MLQHRHHQKGLDFFMIILVVNAGSSSLKYQLIDMKDESVIAKGNCDRIGIDGHLSHKTADGRKVEEDCNFPTHAEAFERLVQALTTGDAAVISSMDEVSAVGHRVVQGAELFTKTTLVTDEVIDEIENLKELAPVHNHGHALALWACKKTMPNIPQVVVFDTAFHQTMPEHAYLYAIPYELYKKYGVRRYGFHGTSHRYVSQRVCEYLGIKPEGLKLITCHIGNGGSIAAIKDGKCIDTSMGLTPLEGLMMGTRSGDIDAGAVTFIMDKEGLTTTGISNLLNKKSGVAGMMNGSSDMRDLEAAVAKGDPQAILTEQMYFYRIKKYIGAYAAALGGVDVILFTGGVGENQATCRAGVCEGLEFLGVKLDPEKNKVRGEEAIISTDDSRVKVVVIPTDEELLIASDTMAILDK